jgi:hypothetical protein
MANVADLTAELERVELTPLDRGQSSNPFARRETKWMRLCSEHPAAELGDIEIFRMASDLTDAEVERQLQRQWPRCRVRARFADCVPSARIRGVSG